MHRIGRTARAGASGRAISLCDNGERAYLRQIEKLTRQTMPSVDRRTAGGSRDVETAPARSQRGRGGHEGAGARPHSGRSGRPQANARPAYSPGGHRDAAPRGRRPEAR